MTTTKIKTFKSSAVLRQFTTLFFILSIFGYPFFASLSVLFGLPNTPISISYRFTVLVLGISIIIFSLIKKPIRMTGRGWLMFTFWVIYGSLLINDISFKNIRFRGETPFYLYSFIFGSSFLSFATMLFGGKYLKLTNKFSWKIVIFLTITMLLIWKNINFYGPTTGGFFQGRAIISTEKSFGVVNAILIGSYGAFLSLMSISLLVIRNTYMKIRKQLFLLLSILIGTTSVLFSGSRGPLLVFIIGLFLVFLKYVTFRKAYPVHVVKVLSIITGIIIGFSIVILPLIKQGAITSFTRLMNTITRNEGSNKEVRFYEWQSALQQYLDHPILGDKYVTEYDGFYPHNVYLEVLMTTGTIGGLLFFLAYFLCLNKLRKLWKYSEPYVFPFIVLSVTIFTMRITTGALHNSVEFWAILGLLCSSSGSTFHKLKMQN